MTAPALPSGWTATLVTGDPPTWATSTTTPDSAPNAAFANDQDGISDKTLGLAQHRDQWGVGDKLPEQLQHGI